ncbi:CST complex subunit TEN1-like [Pteropus medius]|uniref:CST complex subunit TEN1-like n=1 Tax=Pteropus vampyrus TaxID=132908 RepID=UPI00196ACBD5|nr:CST complex subunit TEN1-like [Pteropus giganteus]XP_039715443.1 CST complex subunit TEN1-like [Pteropus giganteus]
MMLPKPGIYYFPWEVSAGQVPDGGTLRTFGRLCLYDMTRSRVTLMAQHGSDQHQVLVCTKLVEPFQAQVGSLYLVIGELGHQQDQPEISEPPRERVIGLRAYLPQGSEREGRETLSFRRPGTGRFPYIFLKLLTSP